MAYPPAPSPLPLLPPSPAPVVVRDGGEVLAGAATGALMGAAVSMPRYAGENAAIGAFLGAMFTSLAQESRARSLERAQAQAQCAQPAARSAAQAPRPGSAGFRRAMTACMNGRGYRVGCRTCDDDCHPISRLGRAPGIAHWPALRTDACTNVRAGRGAGCGTR